MRYSDYLFEVKDLGKGMGPVGAKMSKSIGMPGVSVANKNKLVKKPGQTSPKKTPVPKEPKGMTPDTSKEPSEEPKKEVEAASPEEGGEVLDTGPEVVEKLPDPEDIKFDKLGAPDKHHLIGHIVRWGSKEYVLDWDYEFEVYKIVDPGTLRVKTRVRPDSISTVDYKVESMRNAIKMAIHESYEGTPIEYLVDNLLIGYVYG